MTGNRPFSTLMFVLVALSVSNWAAAQVDEADETIPAEEMPPEGPMPPATESDFKGMDDGTGADLGSPYTETAQSCDEALAQEEAEWEYLEGALDSIPCAPGQVFWNVRVALGDLLDGTPADLDGIADRATWYASFPATKVFPMGAEIAGIKWRYNSLGTVGLVASTGSDDGERRGRTLDERLDALPVAEDALPAAADSSQTAQGAAPAPQIAAA